MIIRPALSADAIPLAKLAALTPMGGTIGLRIDRNPDFFLLLKERGEFTVWVAEDKNGVLVGCFSATREGFQILGETKWVFYLGDLKIHPRYRGGILAWRLVKQMYRQLVKDGADLVFCTAARGNEPAMAFFEGRGGIPRFVKLAEFISFQLIPRHVRLPAVPFDGCTQELAEFYRGFYCRYAFYPTVDLTGVCTHFIARKGKDIAAAVSVFDPAPLKQNVVVNYPPAIAVTLAALKLLRPLLRLPKLPKKGSPLKMLYIRYLGFADNRESELAALLIQVRGFAYANHYHLVSVAVDKRDRSLEELIRPFSRFVFHSDGLMTSLAGDTELMQTISKGVVYKDFSLL